MGFSMVKRTVKDLEASIRARLLNYSRKTAENYNAVLLLFFQERFLARLGISPYKNHFVLKGGLLLLTQHIATFRPTVDIDMLGVAISNDPEQLIKVIKEIAGLELNDGVRFDNRMKDFYDILFLAENNTFELKKLRNAIEATFIQRETDLESRFFIYEQEYISEKENLWKAFLKKIGSDGTSDFSQIILQIKEFIEPVIKAKASELGFVWKPRIRSWEKQKLIDS